MTHSLETLTVDVTPSDPTVDIGIWDATVFFAEFSCADPNLCFGANTTGAGQTEHYTFQHDSRSDHYIVVDTPPGHEGCFTLRARIQ